MFRNGSHDRAVASDPGQDVDELSFKVSPAAGARLSTVDSTRCIPKDVPSDQITTLKYTQFDDLSADENRYPHLPSQQSAHSLQKSSSKEDPIQSPVPWRNEPTETTTLLGQESALPKHWGDDFSESKSETIWKDELILLIRTASPLIVTCLLQYTLTGASVLAVGHLGKNELGAVSLASMTSNLTGYVVYEGLCTGLDTLCAQVYGSGKLHLVGLHLQRMTFFLWLVTIPIAAIWLGATQILSLLIPEKECARLAGLYLKILLLGAPGFAAFEAGKRFVQAQGLFAANLYVLLFCAPLNGFIHWLFVWRLKWGFVGAPIAVALTHNLLALSLLLYVYFINGSQCWPGFSKQALRNWGPMIKLGFSGFLMVIAEFLAFEILTLASSYISNTTLAAQAALASLSVVTFQIPFPISTAGSTHLANLIGARLPGAAKICIQVTLVMAFAAGLLNMVLLTTLRDYIPKLFTADVEVRAVIATVLPIFAAFQLFDAGVAAVNGIMRGMGRQALGSWVNMFCYYLIAIPVSLGFAFALRWGLFGLWMGPPTGLFLVTTIEGWFIYNTDWDHIIEVAWRLNESA